MGAEAGRFEAKTGARALPLWNTLLAPAVVALAYFVACRIGFVLRFPPATTSVLWPPNSVLTAALLILPRDRWALCLALVLPAHLVVELQAGLPLGLVLALYVTNCGEALLAASIVRRLSDAPARFDSLDRALAFIAGAVVISPLVSTFVDAAAIALFQGEPYWAVWGRRLPSNALAGLTVVPSAVSLATAGWSSVRSSSARRKVEASALALSLIAVGRVVFVGPAERGFDLPGAPYTSLSFLLPLLLWAAVRFGVAAASLSLLATVLLASWTATQGFHPLGNLPASTGVFAMQVFLLVIGIPLTFVAALVEEKRRIEHALRENLAFEKMLSEISGTFVHAGSDRLDAAFESALARLGESLRVDQVVLSSVEAGKDWSWSRNADSRSTNESLLTEPLVVDGRTLGDLSILAGTSGEPPEDLAPRLRLVAVVLANALARDRAEREARRNRDDLAHSLRVSTMGVLAGSLAHELNQPLGAIMANAETALERVQEGSAGREEILEILRDVIEDDQRAGDVIARMRSMLKKGESHHAPFDVNQTIRDAAHLLRGDTLAHGVTLRLHLAPGGPLVHGDRVQIQQVLVNLILNGIEATAGAASDGQVLVRTSLVENMVEVSVEDLGPGLPEGFEDRIFQPFHSTKPEGMGMGLSISRSIVEAHGGRLRASNGPAGGAVLTFSLALLRPVEPKSNSQPLLDS
jgi:signal transduction histidine kinase